MPLKVFLSAVSAEFRACRDALASDLRAIGCEVRVQEDFQQGTGTLLRRLQEYVHECDRVIALVGDAFGSPAPGIAGVPGLRSYTQWEYAFAQGERLDGPSQPPKELHVYVAAPACRAAHAVTEPLAARQSQREFVDRIQASGKHWTPFASADELCRRVLRDVWRIDTVRRPSLDAYLAARVAEWCAPRHALDRLFTPLTIAVQDDEWALAAAAPRTSRDPHELVALADPACLLLGPPGGGKSTLLRWLELDLARQALAAGGSPVPIPLYLPLGRYRRRPADPPLTPMSWLEREWARLQPAGPAFDALLRAGRVVLLLDALNEMPRAGPDEQRAAMEDWRDFVGALPRVGPGTRVVFSCRELDYSISLASSDRPVRQARVLPLDDEQVRAFIAAHGSSASAPRAPLGDPLPQLERSPYYLRLALAQPSVQAAGRAALFSGFVRHALAREVEADSPLFQAGRLLDARDREALVRRRHAADATHALPRRGALFGDLSRLALDILRRPHPGPAQAGQSFDAVLARLGGAAHESTLHAGIALQVLDAQGDQVRFTHQLMQAYFAARAVVALAPEDLAGLLASTGRAWRAGEVAPALPDALRQLGPQEPLAPLQPTALDEALPFATAMHPQPEDLLARLAEINLPLAGRCAAELGGALPPALRAELGRQLVARATDPDADMRARIAAACALGELGDPRLARSTGPDGEYLLPPLVRIPAGEYTVGLDLGGRANEAPAHRVRLGAFRIARWPVTNAEFACFVRAGGYDDSRWWQGAAAEAWRDGSDTGRLARREWRAEREHWRARLHEFPALERQGRLTAAQAAYWATAACLSDDECEQWLDRMYAAGRQTEPRFWNDAGFNHPAQPVVGISWYEAMAYCRWLSAQTGQALALPGEAQWEAAARGPEGGLYPAGRPWDEHCGNTAPWHLHRTSPVGVFPRGATPHGVDDLIGNVWEWTRSAHAPYPSAPVADCGADTDCERVARGAAYSFGREYVRASYRYHVVPDARRRRIGFRLVLEG